jgi:hypothetical protein
MALTITNSSGATVMTAVTPLNVLVGGVYYLKRLKVESPLRKITIDSSPSVNGSFAQDFGDHSWPITGGSVMLVDSSEANLLAAFEIFAGLIKHQIGMTLSMDNETASPFANCVCTGFELYRRLPPDKRKVIPNGNGTFRCCIDIDFVQLSK